MLAGVYFHLLCRRVLDLIEVVHTAGMTAPWLPVPALVALTCDYMAPATATKALAVLKKVVTAGCVAYSLHHITAQLVDQDSGACHDRHH